MGFQALAVRALTALLAASPAIAAGATITGACIADRYGATLNCNSSDVFVKSMLASEGVVHGCDFPGDVATISPLVTLRSIITRADAAVYLALDGGDAHTGVCSLSTASNAAPFSDLDGDACGDITGNTDSALAVASVEVECWDADGDGLADVVWCTSWNQIGDGAQCTVPADGVPTSPTRCSCGRANIANLPVPRVIEIRAASSPANDTGTFDLRFDGQTWAEGVGDGGSSGLIAASAGSHNVSETASASTLLDDYETSIDCTDAVGRCSLDPSRRCIANAGCADGEVLAGVCIYGPTTLASCTSCTSLPLTLPIDPFHATCTITNVHVGKGNIVVAMAPMPVGESQTFAFSASYDAGGFTLAIGQQHDSGPIPAHAQAVTETVPPGWLLTSATCSDGSPPDAIALGDGETVTCTFTNFHDRVFRSGFETPAP